MELNLIRNGYNYQRRKMYPSNPRNNLVSTVDFIWNKSLEDENNLPTHKLKNKQFFQKQQIKNHYNDLIQKQMQLERSLDKTSFRVIPIQKQSIQLSNPNKNKSFFQQSYNSRKPSANQPTSRYSNNHQAQLYSPLRQNNYNSQRNQPSSSLDFRKNQTMPIYRQNQNTPTYRQNQSIPVYRTSNQILNPTSTKIQGRQQLQLKSSSNLSRTVFGYEINPQNFKRQSYLTKILSDRLQPYIQQSISGNKGHRRHKSVMINQIIDLNY